MAKISPVQVITTKELSRHNTPKSAWIAVRGKVYDITSYIARHPGGADVLLIAAGRDATTVFETYHSLDEIGPLKTLNKFFVGELERDGNELPVFPETGPFYSEVKAAVGEYFARTGQDPKFHWAMVLRYALVFLTVFGSYYAMFFVETVVSRWPLQSLFALIMGFGCAQVCEFVYSGVC